MCKSSKDHPENYFQHLAGWTHSYVNFEMAEPVEIEIAKADGSPINSAAPHPKRNAKSCLVRDGKAYLELEKPCLMTVDINGQMDGQNTGMGYKGPAIHVISIFANPPINNKPDPNDPSVLCVKPGEIPPHDGLWKTLYFLPGVHDIGVGFPVHAHRQYYIPGDAIVYGTINNIKSKKKWEDGHHIRIFGLGTLSGARLQHPEFVVPTVKEPELYNPIHIVGAKDTSVEGITIADSAHHSLMLMSTYAPSNPTDVRWVKIFTWRGNGDGINPFGNGLVEDCFIRTQDDSLYVSGRGIRRIVIWNDYNGSSFVLSSLPQLTERKLVVEDCDVIYSRAGWNKWSGGRVFNMRGEGGGDCGSGVIFQNINVEDPRPTLQQFFINMTIPKPYSDGTISRKPGNLSKVIFRNITIQKSSVIGEPQMLWGAEGCRITDLTFDGLVIAGEPVKSDALFKKNEFVSNLIFTETIK
jgi:hypothetical protein